MKYKFCYEALQMYLAELPISSQATVDSVYNLRFATWRVMIQGLPGEEDVLN